MVNEMTDEQRQLAHDFNRARNEREALRRKMGLTLGEYEAHRTPENAARLRAAVRAFQDAQRVAHAKLRTVRVALGLEAA